MRKAHTRPPPSALTKQDIAHFNWIQRNSMDLVRSALKLYRKRGRGAFIIREDEAKPSGTSAHYLAVNGMQTPGIVWPDQQTAERVRAYDPTQQFIIVFMYRSGAASSYTMHFVQMDDTFTVDVA
jgi:hypothetical protein